MFARRPTSSRITLAALSLAFSVFATAAAAQTTTQTPPNKPFEPTVGQAGKDVVWVPTPDALVQKMLDMAKVTPSDYLIDLGSGDGKTVIAAAKRGLRAKGIEYNPDMVELSKRNAQQAGVSDKATFEKADIFESDFSNAQVITMFLLPSLNMRLRPTLLNLKPGTRIVSNSFTMEDWEADQTETISENCVSWCTAMLWIIPAKVQGVWTMPQGDLTITQEFQKFSGTLGTTRLTDEQLRGDQISFKVGGVEYTGRVTGNTMSGTSAGGSARWTATKK